MTKTWEPVGRTIQEIMMRCRELGGNPPDAWKGATVADLATTIRLAEAKERPACDAIMRALLQPGGVVGRPTPIQGYFCAMRAMCALDTLGIFHAELHAPLYPSPPAGWSDAQLSEWLLVANWQQRHDTWLKLIAFAAATGRNFYSG